MKKRILTTLFASLFCLGLTLQQARAGNPRGLTLPDKPDLEITNASAESSTKVKFTIVSHGADVPANTVTVLVVMSAPGTKNTIWDDQHEYVIGSPLTADVPAEFTIELPKEKDLGGKYVNLLIDPYNKVDESNEQNNVSKNLPMVPKSSNFPTLIDVKFVPALYFHLGQPDAQAGEPGKPLKVHKSQTQSCDDNWCVALTLRMQKDPAKLGIFVDFKIKNLTNGYEQEGSGVLPEGETKIDKSFAVGLKVGENKLRLELKAVYMKDGQTSIDTDYLEVPVTLVDK